METAARLIAAAGQQLSVVPQVEFAERALSRSRTTLVPTFLPRLPVRQALATIALPASRSSSSACPRLRAFSSPAGQPWSPHLITRPTGTSTSSRGSGPPNVRTHLSNSWLAIYDTL
jgi:hypothetical protein